ncbi:MAG: hypothetical protein FWD53_09620 [Phycisphaerales bacterium]|nr:hypothetical protein [Phycisphaerales bacterium]
MKKRILHILAILSLTCFVVLAVCMIVSCFHPLAIVLHDPYENIWFHLGGDYYDHGVYQRHSVVKELNDINHYFEDGSYPHAAWDTGIFPSHFYVRKSLYIPKSKVLPTGEWIEFNDPYYDYAHRFLGIVWKCVWDNGKVSNFVAIPTWLLLLLFSIFPLWQFRQHIHSRRQRRSLNLCSICSYDLRVQLAGAGGDRCPECGTPLRQSELRA